jgi:hypothetical protein
VGNIFRNGLTIHRSVVSTSFSVFLCSFDAQNEIILIKSFYKVPIQNIDNFLQIEVRDFSGLCENSACL